MGVATAYDYCRICGDSEREHHALGLCQPCYRKEYRKRPDKRAKLNAYSKQRVIADSETHYQRCQRWRKAHKERCNELQRRLRAKAFLNLGDRYIEVERMRCAREDGELVATVKLPKTGKTITVPRRHVVFYWDPGYYAIKEALNV